MKSLGHISVLASHHHLPKSVNFSICFKGKCHSKSQCDPIFPKGGCSAKNGKLFVKHPPPSSKWIFIWEARRLSPKQELNNHPIKKKQPFCLSHWAVSAFNIFLFGRIYTCVIWGGETAQLERGGDIQWICRGANEDIWLFPTSKKSRSSWSGDGSTEERQINWWRNYQDQKKSSWPWAILSIEYKKQKLEDSPHHLASSSKFASCGLYRMYYSYWNYSVWYMLISIFVGRLSTKALALVPLLKLTDYMFIILFFQTSDDDAFSLSRYKNWYTSLVSGGFVPVSFFTDEIPGPRCTSS